MNVDLFHQVYSPVGGSVLFSALIASLPPLLLAILLAGLRVAPWRAAMAAAGTAFVLAWVVWGMPLDPRNFNRKVANTEGFVEPTDARRVPETGRPAALYRRGPAQTLNPPLLRNGSAR